MKTYNINTRITDYNTFKDLPLDLKKLYLHSLIRAYNASGVKIAQSMNVSPTTLYAHLKSLGIELGLSSGGRKPKPDWEKFMAGTYTSTGVPIASCPPDVEIVVPEEPTPEEAEPDSEEVVPPVYEKTEAEPEAEVEHPTEVYPEYQSFVIGKATPDEFIDYLRRVTIADAKYSFTGCIVVKED